MNGVEPYKNVKLAVAGITGTIYLTRMLPANKSRKYPIMSDKRRDVTREAVVAVADHMMHQLKNAGPNSSELTFTFEGFGTLTWKNWEADSNV